MMKLRYHFISTRTLSYEIGKNFYLDRANGSIGHISIQVGVFSKNVLVNAHADKLAVNLVRHTESTSKKLSISR